MNAKEIKDLRRLMGKNQEEFDEILGVHKKKDMYYRGNYGVSLFDLQVVTN